MGEKAQISNRTCTLDAQIETESEISPKAKDQDAGLKQRPKRKVDKCAKAIGIRYPGATKWTARGAQELGRAKCQGGTRISIERGRLRRRAGGE